MTDKKPGPAPWPTERVQSVHLRVRVTPDVAERFSAACRRRGTDVTRNLRALVMDFIARSENEWRGK